MKAGFIARLAFLIALTNTTVVVAEECKPLKLLNKIQMVRGKEQDWGVPTTINGKERILALGLGSPNSILTKNTIGDLNLPVQQGNVIMADMDGNVSRGLAKVKDFTFGYIHGANRFFVVWPAPDDNPDGWAGILSRDFLFGYDVDIDFGTGILSLFEQDHCSDRVGYWVEPPPSTDVTFKDHKVTFPVTLDGHSFNAIAVLNNYSFMNEKVAEQVFGLSATGTEQVPLPGSMKVPPLTGYIHTFGNLSFGGATVKNLRVFIVQDAMGRLADKRQQTGNRALIEDSELKLPDLTIGMNVLKYLHVNIAPKAGKLYVSGTSSAPENAAPPP